MPFSELDDVRLAHYIAQMDITKRAVREALGGNGVSAKDADVARFFGVTAGAVSQWPDDAPLPAGRQWQARALRPDLFRVQPASPDEGMTKRALMRCLALTSDTSLAVLLQLPRETVEGWADNAIVPVSPQLQALLADAPAAAVLQEPEDPDAARIVPVETA